MKSFCFTVDDNIRFLKELTETPRGSLFDHPYLAMYRRLHDAYGIAVQLNLFYELEDFDLSHMTDRYRTEWEQNASWLRLSFHSRMENKRPYEQADYSTVLKDCRAVQSEILRFAGDDSLAKTTTVHYCLTTEEGTKALYDCGVRGLLGLYGTDEAPRSSYQIDEKEAERLRHGHMVWRDGIAHAGINLIVNTCDRETCLARLSALVERPFVSLMIHEQYFYEDYPCYQPDFEEKLCACFALLKRHGFESVFLEDAIERIPHAD